MCESSPITFIFASIELTPRVNGNNQVTPRVNGNNQAV